MLTGSEGIRKKTKIKPENCNSVHKGKGLPKNKNNPKLRPNTTHTTQDIDIFKYKPLWLLRHQ